MHVSLYFNFVRAFRAYYSCVYILCNAKIGLTHINKSQILTNNNSRLNVSRAYENNNKKIITKKSIFYFITLTHFTFLSFLKW